MAFSFGFAGDDIDSTVGVENSDAAPHQSSTAGAFPVPGKPQLPATQHDLQSLLSRLPSKIAYDLLDIGLDDGSTIQIPRRELWDVRVQLMAEDVDGTQDANADGSGLGAHDVKTGVYEGGFKSWESSVDLVKVIAAQGYKSKIDQGGLRVIELGCGTALPTLSIFQAAMASQEIRQSTFVLADYNPTVLQLVTVPNLILSWALQHQQETEILQEAFSMDGELELIPGVIDAFQDFLNQKNIKITLLSGAWSQEFVNLLYPGFDAATSSHSIIIGAETIYSPFALQAFSETLFSIFHREKAQDTVALIGAKKLYFGVGGSLDDFIAEAKRRGAKVETLREEAGGVRRGVVRCSV